ncbi:hypothetical protein [Mucilaginibacter dorajii]|uniref:hypothetical protein n=1 Tax=Mucilaginibacter dorajii TaxID=692994 RepID=UPI00216858D1|nr:hypothetical protein [Mucilaginibacter dorajii]MCS3732338.1 hypothetical protein [Mucilaginibacter dorajii]
MVNKTEISPERKVGLINRLLANNISIPNLRDLRQTVNAADLSVIITRIYDLNETEIFKVALLDGFLKKLDDLKNARRNARFTKKMEGGFRNGKNMVILAEGDSWFNYPVILTDVIDRICMEKNMAVYSLASGGDWLLNMLNARNYVEQLSVIRPDVFLISAGGNDLVGSRRLAAIVDPTGASIAYQNNLWAQKLITKAEKNIVPLDPEKFRDGLKYLSRDFFALLMFFHLQYYFLIRGILTGGVKDGEPKFPGIRIITQGYDFAIPSYDKRWGIKPWLWYVPLIRSFAGHGTWLKTPLQIRGINKPETQENVVYAMIYLFNEMMIEMGTIFEEDDKIKGRVFHIDSRDSLGKDGWTDELHPKPNHFMNTGHCFVKCINGEAVTYGNVYVVKSIFP